MSLEGGLDDEELKQGYVTEKRRATEGNAERTFYSKGAPETHVSEPPGPTT